MASSSPGKSPFALRLLATVALLIGWAGLLLQLWLTVGIVMAQGRGWPMGLVVYFGFFTILTNLLATVALSAWRIGPGLPGHRWLTHPVLLTTAAAAITIVGLVYFFILRHTWKPEGAQFAADAVLHYVMPTLVVVFWAWAVPAHAIGWARLPWLLVYPLAYLVYVFVRGAIVASYPYEFIDVLNIGYPAALRNSMAFMAAYALVVGVYAGSKALMHRRGDGHEDKNIDTKRLQP